MNDERYIRILGKNIQVRRRIYGYDFDIIEAGTVLEPLRTMCASSWTIDQIKRHTRQCEEMVERMRCLNG